MTALLRSTRLKLGVLLGKASANGDSSDNHSALNTLLENIITSSAIEGERLMHNPFVPLWQNDYSYPVRKMLPIPPLNEQKVWPR